ncbi:MAG: hypothetical protein AB8I08_14205 [Sandaracinaceae bacterium]
MRRPLSAAIFCVSLLSSAGCGLLDEETDEPPPPDPALAPPVALPAPSPAPVAPTPAPVAQPASPGTFTIPGLEGLSIPLPAPQGPYTPPEPPAVGTLTPAPGGSFDGQGKMPSAFLATRAGDVHRALVAALDSHENSQVRDIPFRVVTEARQPNAAAACRGGTPLMMITSSMLELAAGISEATAYDETAGTETYEAYVTSVVEAVRGQRPIPRGGAGVHTAPHATNPHKLARQLHLFDQQVAFIIGHELAHHYRGHTSCVGGRSDAEVQRDELARILSRTVPPFEQPREVEADMWGLTNVLEAGRSRTGGTWTEEGGLLNLDFFRRLSDRGGAELIMVFLSTHPASFIRIPIVRSTAQQWQPGWRPPRMPVPGETGTGPGIDVPTPIGNVRLPSNLPIDPSQLPIPFPLAPAPAQGNP